ILSDSDNDAVPVGDEIYWESPTAEQKNAAKEARPNSYTLYHLSCCTDKNGDDYWKIVNYDPMGLAADDMTFIVTIGALPLYSEELIEKHTETEGTKSITDTPDFVAEDVFTTAAESLPDRLMNRAAYLETIKDSFEYGDPISIGCYISNRSPLL
ncbi:MAG: hypothetical protein J5822_05715, partial [Eubacteriaceae bacterium]|nr:hypothetical protein [Eubacteriaceae bacterium]